MTTAGEPTPGTGYDLIQYWSQRALNLEDDAERYRLLRRGQRWSVINGIGEILRAESLDASIDALRAALAKDVLEGGK